MRGRCSKGGDRWRDVGARGERGSSWVGGGFRSICHVGMEKRRAAWRPLLLLPRIRARPGGTGATVRLPTAYCGLAGRSCGLYWKKSAHFWHALMQWPAKAAATRTAGRGRRWMRRLLRSGRCTVRHRHRHRAAACRWRSLHRECTSVHAVQGAGPSGREQGGDSWLASRSPGRSAVPIMYTGLRSHSPAPAHDSHAASPSLQSG